MKSFMLVSLAALAGCITYAHSSRDLLGDDGSRALVARDLDGTAREVTRLFASRGFPSYSSIFYARMQQLGDATTALVLLGHPTIDGREYCPESEATPGCDATWRGGDAIDGEGEAVAVHGVLTELAVDPLIAGPVPANLDLQVDPRPCAELRKVAFDHALANNDEVERDRELANLPRCPAVAQNL